MIRAGIVLVFLLPARIKICVLNCAVNMCVLSIMPRYATVKGRNCETRIEARIIAYSAGSNAGFRIITPILVTRRIFAASSPARTRDKRPSPLIINART